MPISREDAINALEASGFTREESEREVEKMEADPAGYISRVADYAKEVYQGKDPRNPSGSLTPNARSFSSDGTRSGFQMGIYSDAMNMLDAVQTVVGYAMENDIVPPDDVEKAIEAIGYLGATKENYESYSMKDLPTDETTTEVANTEIADAALGVDYAVPDEAMTTSDANVTGYMTDQEVRDAITEEATKRGIDPEIAIAVAEAEGLNSSAVGENRASRVDVDKNGVPYSYGPYQLNDKNGLGKTFEQQTGLSVRDPATTKQQIEFALNEAALNGWGAWAGAAKRGIADWAGLINATPVGLSTEQTLPTKGPVPSWRDDAIAQQPASLEERMADETDIVSELEKEAAAKALGLFEKDEWEKAELTAMLDDMDMSGVLENSFNSGFDPNATVERSDLSADPYAGLDPNTMDFYGLDPFFDASSTVNVSTQEPDDVPDALTVDDSEELAAMANSMMGATTPTLERSEYTPDFNIGADAMLDSSDPAFADGYMAAMAELEAELSGIVGSASPGAGLNANPGYDPNASIDLGVEPTTTFDPDYEPPDDDGYSVPHSLESGFFDPYNSGYVSTDRTASVYDNTTDDPALTADDPNDPASYNVGYYGDPYEQTAQSIANTAGLPSMDLSAVADSLSDVTFDSGFLNPVDVPGSANVVTDAPAVSTAATMVGPTTEPAIETDVNTLDDDKTTDWSDAIKGGIKGLVMGGPLGAVVGIVANSPSVQNSLGGMVSGLADTFGGNGTNGMTGDGRAAAGGNTVYDGTTQGFNSSYSTVVNDYDASSLVSADGSQTMGGPGGTSPK